MAFKRSNSASVVKSTVLMSVTEDPCPEISSDTLRESKSTTYKPRVPDVIQSTEEEGELCETRE